MSTGLENIRERMAGYLTERGVRAVTAWPQGQRQMLEAPVAVVSLRACEAGPAGFQNYLGERYNETTGLWEELYGRKVRLTFGLDLYAPARGDGAELQAAFDTLAAALAGDGPQGLEVLEFSCGETEHDSQARLLKRTAQAVCQAWLYSTPQSGGLFLDFELRGGWKT